MVIIAIILLLIGLLVWWYLWRSYYKNSIGKLISLILLIIVAFFAAWMALRYAQDGLWASRPSSALWTWFIFSSIIALVSLLNGWSGCGDASCGCARWWACMRWNQSHSSTSHASAGTTTAAVATSGGSHTQTNFTGKPDDLKKVEWIGPVIEKHLNTNGIHTFEQLADADPVHVKSILDLEWDRFQNHQPDTRPAQAAMARDWARDKLKKRQDELDGGRVK